MTSRTNVVVLFGGRSGEHAVSVTSARAVIAAIDSMSDRYRVVPVAITLAGRWVHDGPRLREMIAACAGYKPLPPEADQLPAVLPDPSGGLRLVNQDGSVSSLDVDVVFPVTHGPLGEDGTLQGLLEMCAIPYVGCGVLASATAMDKVVAKRLLVAAGLDALDCVDFTASEWQRDRAGICSRVDATIGYDCFVKPVNMGSSVGISKVHGDHELVAAIEEALRWDRKVMVERAATDFYEIECAVLGNDDPEASRPGEIRPSNEFYDYKAKYLDGASQEIAPATVLTPAQEETIRAQALAAYRALGCSGLARVDFLVARSGSHIWVNELNTIPGFTPISMFPKMWEVSGLPFVRLVDRLIQLAAEQGCARPSGS